jgi:FtsH-binding integral membrane protein
MMPGMANEQNRLAKALNPAVPIYRDAYNEYFVFVLSALGASVICPVVFYIVMAFTDLWGLVPFAAACVVLELVLIFGLARPQMKPQERAGWGLLWGFTAAALGLAFYELVAKPTIG